MRKTIDLINEYKRQVLVVILLIFFIGLTFYLVQRRNAADQFNLSDDQKILYEQYFALVRDRVAYVEYAKSYSNTENENVNRNEVFEELKSSRQEALEVINKDAQDLEESNNDNSEFKQRYQEMRSSAVETLDRQGELVERLEVLNNLFSGFYSFRPENITLSDLEDNREQLIEDASQSGARMGNIRTAIENECGSGNDILTSEECRHLEQKLQEIENLLLEFGTNLSNQDMERAKETLDSITEKQNELDTKISGIYTDEIRSQESVQMLTDLTNLILEYRFYLEKN